MGIGIFDAHRKLRVNWASPNTNTINRSNMSELLLADEKQQENREAAALNPEDLYEAQISFFSRASLDGASIQQLLAAAKVVVIGGGVVGSHTLASLADAGVGTLRILDSSTVERNNLAGNA